MTPVDRMRAALHAAPVQGAPLDGWLIYDFQGLNPHARRVLDIPEGVFLTRRFFVYVPRHGQAVVLHNHIEAGNWRTVTQGWDAELRPFGSHAELDAALKRVVGGKRLAMEYSPQGAVPYISRVDAGTIERVRAAGATEILSSADLLQAFLVWSSDDLAAHRRAMRVLTTAKDEAFALMHERLKARQSVTELEVQTLIMERIHGAGLQAGHNVNVSFGVNAADSHYEPSPDPSAGKNATLEPGQCVLIDLWAQEPGRPFGDVTWVGYAGTPTAEYLDAWDSVQRARDTALGLLTSRHAAQGWGSLQGWELDRAARDAMHPQWAQYFLHRTGHDLGVQIHGSGANLDDYETRDTRTLTPGLCVTIEPGTYPAHKGFGIRSEINVYLAPSGPELTSDIQRWPFVLGEGDWAQVRAKGYGEE